MFKQMKKAKNEIFLMAILFSLFFIMLFYDEKTAVLNTFPCLFILFAENVFTQDV
ncbi:TPA: hypothetical protein ACIQN7_002752 [Bacillus cereus]